MAATALNPETDPVAGGDRPDAGDDQESSDAIAIASLALSSVGFLTLLRLADRRERSPASALGLFLATSAESITGAVLGLVSVTRTSDGARRTRPFLFGAAGAVLGVFTTLLNVNWMRTRRRP
jgi:hypothetical protein